MSTVAEYERWKSQYLNARVAKTSRTARQGLNKCAVDLVATIPKTIPPNLGSSFAEDMVHGRPVLYFSTPYSPTVGRQRYNLENSDCLYVSSDELAVMDERRSKGFLVTDPHRKYWLEVKLNNVLDLRYDQPFQAIGVRKNSLCLDWEEFNKFHPNINAPSQIIGHAASQAGYEGLVFASTKAPPAFNVAIYKKNIQPPSFLRIMDSRNTFSMFGSPSLNFP